MQESELNAMSIAELKHLYEEIEADYLTDKISLRAYYLMSQDIAEAIRKKKQKA